MCEELIARKLRSIGINTRVTDILRDADLLPLYRKAGLLTFRSARKPRRR